MQTIGELIQANRSNVITQGTEHGTCAMCRRAISNGLKVEFNNCFTLSEYVFGYPIVCPECWYTYRDAWFRSNCWIVTPTRLEKLERKNVVITFLHQLEFPCAIYTTDQYKKQGYLQYMNKGLWIHPEYLCWGWDTIFLASSRTKFISYIQQYLKMQRAGLTRTMIETGCISSRQFQKIPEDQRLALFSWLRVHRQDLLWQWMIAFMPRNDLPEWTQINNLIEGNS